MKEENIILNSNIFKEYFLEDGRWDEENLTLNIMPNFTLPEEIGFIIDAKEQELINKKLKNTLYYKGERKLIDAGNVRVNLEQTLDNSENSLKELILGWISGIQRFIPLWKSDYRL